MAINWTNNGTDNKWGENTTARFEATGDLPSWVTSGQIDGDVYYVTSNGTTTKATGINDGAVYSNGKLTITVSISMDINDWTVQVHGTNSSNVLRWPGFGAVSATWADPGCQADDAQSGDLTHLIVRTYEIQDGDSWLAVQSINQPAGGTYRITYNVTDGHLDADPVTRVVTLPPQHILTSMGDYVSYTELGWTYTQDLNGRPEGDTNYTYQISTGGPDTNSFNSNIIQSINEASFKSEKVFFGLDSCTTYYSRVVATGDQPAIGGISSNYTDPCTAFSATREVDTSTGTVTLNVITTDANEGVYYTEELVEGQIRGLVKPIADDEESDLYMASGEGRPRTTTQTAGGRMYFDCGFLKYFGDRYESDSTGYVYGQGWSDTYADDLFAPGVPAEFSILGNAYNYCGANREVKTNKVLYINDQPSSTDNALGDGTYGVAGSANFPKTLSGIAQAVGSTLEHFDNNTTSPHAVKLESGTLPNGESSWKDYFKKYDVIIWIGSTRYRSGDDNNVDGMKPYTLSPTLLTELMDAIDDGVGIITLTDHNIFQSTVNQVIRYFGVEYYGNIDRDNTKTAYKINTILNNKKYIPQGYHPLLANLDPNSSITAGVSEGKLRYVSTSGADGVNVGRTSSSTSDSNKTLTTTTHSDGVAIGGGKLIVRTANDCGKIFEAVTLPATTTAETDFMT